MKVQRDKLQQYQKRIKVVTDRETEVARECLRQGHKDKALLALRRKKYQESLLTKTDQQLAQLQALTSDVEFALVQKDVVFGLQQGTAVLKEIHKEMGGLERVELILSESDEARAYQNVSLSGERHDCEEVGLTMVSRKSTSCLVGKCRMKTRTRWKTSFWLWNEKRAVCLPCPMPLHQFRSLCLVFPQTTLSGQGKGKSKGRNSGVLKKQWQHERFILAVFTGRGDSFANELGLIHNTQIIEQRPLITRQVANSGWLILCVGNNAIANVFQRSTRDKTLWRC